MPKDHMEGFENEALFVKAFAELSTECPRLKTWVAQKFLSHFVPELVNDLYEFRPCKRKLIYIGNRDFDLTEAEKKKFDEEEERDDPFFKIGQLYESEAFNGATYVIKGKDDSPIGCAYFDWID